MKQRDSATELRERHRWTQTQRDQASGIGQGCFPLWDWWKNETKKGKTHRVENRMQGWLRFH